jgi:thymidine kinase
MNNPKFIIFTGPMFGSKTTRLFAVLDRYKYQKRKILAFKPSIDERYTLRKISTHSGASMPARTVRNGQELSDFIKEYDQCDVIAVDEAFMIPGASSTLINAYKNGKTIVVSSLELSATGNVFEEMAAMFPWATCIEKCPAVCTVCGADAYYTHRKVEDLEEITVGGAELYEPRCWSHHDYFTKTINE